ncbi:MAG: fibronectin type III domain-containing protein, partial [Flavobacteriales bacterium]
IPQATGITGTSYVLGSLTPAVTVYAWVRANCDIDGSSVWTGPVSFTPGLAQIGSGTGTSAYFPIYTYYGYNYSQQIYLASEYTGGTYITKIKFKPTSTLGTVANYNSWVVYMGNTAKTSFTSSTDWVPLASMGQVFSGTISPVQNQWMEITLDVPFLWDGTSNIVIGVDENSPGYVTAVNWQSFASGSNRGMLYYSDGTNPDPASPPTANYAPNANIAQVQFVYDAPPACLPAGGLTVSNITANSANLSWTANSPPPAGYQWEVRTSGAGGDGPVGLTDNGSVTNTTASTSVLASTTNYHLYVRVDCGSAFSPWAGPFNFTTLCSVASTPYLETFDASLNTPNCWTNTATSTTLWLFNASGNFGPDYGVAGAVDHTSGTGNFAWFDGSYNTSIPTMTTGLIDISTLTTPMVSLWVRANNTNDAALNTLKVQAYNGTTWVDLISYAQNAPDWVNLTAVIPSSIPSPAQFRLTIVASTVGSAFYHDILVDDFEVLETPTCLPATALAISNVTGNSADLSWTASITSPAQGYQWEVRTSGAPGSGAIGLGASGTTLAGITTANAGGLATGTEYNAYVRA